MRAHMYKDIDGMEFACDGSEGASVKHKDHGISGHGSSFELEVKDQLSKIVEMVSVRMVTVDAKLDQLLLWLHRGTIMPGEESQIANGAEHSLRAPASPIHQVRSEPSMTDSRKISDQYSFDVEGSNDDQLSDLIFTSHQVCEHREGQEDVGSDESERLSPTHHMVRRMGTSSREIQEGISWAVKSLDNMLSMRRVNEFRLRMWMLLDDPDSGCAARIIYVVMVCIIITSILLTLLQTVDETPIDVKILSMVDTVFDGVFFLEVLLRFIFCPSRWAFFRNGYNIIDFVSAMPMVIRGATGFAVPAAQEQYTAVDFVLIIFVPTLRLLKLLRRFKNLRLLRVAVDIALEALVVPLFLLFIVCLTFSGLIYVLEPRDNITSLPHAVWLVVVTLSTVGYGDTLPRSPGGYVVMTILVASGVLYMAVPISIVGHAWNSVWSRRDEILLMDLARERLKVWGYTAAEMYRLFETFDLNNDQLLDIDEFSCMLSEMRIGLSTQRVAELFDTLDKDKSGFVDYMEFAKALFPDQYIDAVRQRSSQISNADSVSSPKSNQSPSSPKGRRLLRPFSVSSSGAQQRSPSNKMLDRSLSNLSSISARIKRHGGNTQHVRAKTAEGARPRLQDQTDEHPAAHIQNVSPPLPFEERPTTVPKSACQAGFISEASIGMKEDEQISGFNFKGSHGLPLTTAGCTQTPVNSNSMDSLQGLHKL